MLIWRAFKYLMFCRCIPDNLVPALLITIGKADNSKQGVRGYRKVVNEFVEYI